MAIESVNARDSAFLRNEHVYSARHIDDLLFPDFELFAKCCGNRHPMGKYSMSQFLEHVNRKTFRCVQCDEDIGMNRATTSQRGPTFMLCCSQMQKCREPYDATCADCAGFATRTESTEMIANLHAGTLHGQLLSESGLHTLHDIGRSVSVHAARLEALRLLPPETMLTGPGSCPAERPDAPGGLEDWILLDRPDGESDAT